MTKRSITFFACDPEAALHRQLEEETLAEEARMNLEADLERERELLWEVPDEMEPELIPATALLDWDFYRGRA